MNILTVQSTTVNVRSGQSTGAAILREVKVGAQFEVLEIFTYDTTGRLISAPVKNQDYSQWARIVIPDLPGQNCYVCTKILRNAVPLCVIQNVPPLPPLPQGEPERAEVRRQLQSARAAIDAVLALME